METRNKLLYFLGWPWGCTRGVRVDEELSEDYPALVVRGEGASVVSLAPELEEAQSETFRWLKKSKAPVDGAELRDFLFSEDAPAAIETSLFLIPSEGGPRLLSVPGCEIRFGLTEKDMAPLVEAVSEEDWLRGGVAPFARACGVYDAAGDLCAVAGGHLLSGVLDLSVLTRPDKGGRGYAGAALSAMIAAYPDALPLWRAEAENKASLHLAEKMNFVPFLTQEGILLMEEDE